MSSFIILLMMLQCVAYAGTETETGTETGTVIETESNETESNETESNETESNETESNETEGDKTESDVTESDATESDETESDESESDVVTMPSGFSVQAINNSIPVSRVSAGDVFSLRFWLSDIAPMTVMIPLRWDPEIAQVINPETGEPIESGLKAESDILGATGFTVGSKCYDKSEDFAGMKLYWNGVPQFSVNPESDDGYPYLNQDTGFYKLMYYVYLPTTPVEPQMFLEIHFKALKGGDVNFHFATEADAEGMDEWEAKQYYDPVAKDGLITLRNDSDGSGEAVVENYTGKTQLPQVRILTDEDFDVPPELPKPSYGSSPGYIYTPSGITEPGEDEQPKEPVYEAEMRDAEHQDAIFPYDSADKIQARIQMGEDMVVNEDSEYVVPPASVIDYLNELTEMPSSVIYTMPDKLIDKDEYVLNMSDVAVLSVYNAGIPMIYAETPYGYVGINPAVLYEVGISETGVRLCVTPTEDGIKAELYMDTTKLEGFGGNVFRIILPYEQKASDSKVVVTSAQVFGDMEITPQPLSINRYDEERGAVIFLAPCSGEFAVSERESEGFNDLSEVPWAQEPVNGLAQAAIVQGTGGGAFSPMEDVTREQLAKMIVSTTGMYQTDLRTAFTDIAKDSIFYPYVVSANMVGLVNGVSDTQYAGEACITREDLATICYRAVRLLAIDLPEVRGETLFEDDANISDYAREAVYALYQAGIIDGTGSGFDPKGNTSRAAAAKILYGIYQHMQKLL